MNKQTTKLGAVAAPVRVSLKEALDNQPPLQDFFDDPAPFAQPFKPAPQVARQQGAAAQPVARTAARPRAKTAGEFWAATVELFCWAFCLALVAFAYWWGGRSNIAAYQSYGWPVDPENPLSNLWWLSVIGLSAFQITILRSLKEAHSHVTSLKSLVIYGFTFLLGLAAAAWDSGNTFDGFFTWAQGRGFTFGPVHMRPQATDVTSITVIYGLSLAIAVGCEPLAVWYIGKIKATWAKLTRV